MSSLLTTEFAFHAHILNNIVHAHPQNCKHESFTFFFAAGSSGWWVVYRPDLSARVATAVPDAGSVHSKQSELESIAVDMIGTLLGGNVGLSLGVLPGGVLCAKMQGRDDKMIRVRKMSTWENATQRLGRQHDG